ncbi:MAG: hypothetical protein JST25_05865 [Actinobacteria bacterium]|nr:hypothetical protein [Actinomycetota bacterium]
MILAAFLLLSVGLVDVLRGFLRGRAFWIGSAVAAVLLLVLGVLGDAVLFALLGIVLSALWAWLLPLDGRPRLSFWPAVLLALVAVVAVALIPARAAAGLLSGTPLATPIGPVGFDLALLAAGVFAVLLESGNVIVRAALIGERAKLPADVDPGRAASADTAQGPAPVHDPGAPTGPEPSASAPDPGFRGGRLIGPLERVIVLLLTLYAAYPLLAAMLAAKGIVRFPEISRDGERGGRAEYFLVGSLVSWVVGLGGALLLWWATHTTV